MLSREAAAKPPSGNLFSRLYDRIENFILYQSTFFRLHLFAFIFIPLISSAIFWGCNGRFGISYLDSLFLCYSAMNVTGLSTVNLSSLTVWQQIILYLLMMMGDITMVSWIMVLVRKEYFKRTCEFEYVAKKRRTPQALRSGQDRKTFVASISPPINAFKAREPVPINNSNNKPSSKKSTEGLSPTFNLIHPTPAQTFDVEKGRVHGHSNSLLFSETNALSSSPEAINTELPSEPMIPVSPQPHGVDFAYSTSITRVNTFRTTRGKGKFIPSRSELLSFSQGVPLTRRATTILTNRLQDANALDSKHKYDMGFPGPVAIARKAIKTFSPNTYRKLERKLTMPYTRTVEGNNVSWLAPNTEIVVGPNSDFHVETLSDDLVEQIGGIEYVALRWLSYMVPLYFIGTQLISFILFAPWLSATNEYNGVFANQLRVVQKPWFSLFQVMGAYTGGGLSLVDEGMVPFQSAYLMVFSLMFVILAGNHALVAKTKSESEKAFSFLLDHPRRFPSHQTWFLVIYIGLEVWTSLSIGPRIVTGLFQGLAARASGFSIVSISSLAPALQFLYVVMMYIAVALSIRSTNVYEEKSLGVFEAQPEEVEEEPTDFGNLGPRQRVGRYLGWHLRRQLSIDIWWLVWGVFLIAIIERDNLLNDDLKWFDLFRVLFELVSAFGGIGLSLGIPTENYSFVGAMRPLSKLVVIVIMVRGRHRGLPVAVDRAVMLPEDMADYLEYIHGSSHDLLCLALALPEPEYYW
ncbi:potassium transporter [Lentinula aciculospora]|uniref:Potassium transporter n=1 Tax=Lentinula aciculospora TaxID=153920 RepID=A0A9W9DQE0_9AGAR|nr:potassium transporter [Lentinula aciculospora]